MKNFNILAILLLSLIIFFTSCNDNTKPKKQKNTSPSNTTTVTNQPTVTTQNPTALEPAQNANGVWHFTCIKGCAGGSGTADKCATCGNTLMHNQIYHGSANVAPTQTQTSPFNTSPAINSAPAAEPSQNAAGVWHYTCTKGCAGGSGAPGACGNCGSALAHNQAYH